MCSFKEKLHEGYCKVVLLSKDVVKVTYLSSMI